MVGWDDFTEVDNPPVGSEGFDANIATGWKEKSFGKRQTTCKEVDVEKCKGTKYLVLVKMNNKWEEEERPCDDPCPKCFECDVSYPAYTIEAYIDKAASWVKKGTKTDTLLRHETLHFTIRQEGSTTAQAAIRALHGLGTSCKDNSAKIYAERDWGNKKKTEWDRQWQSNETLQGQYDTGTDHGRTTTEQGRWEGGYRGK